MVGLSHTLVGTLFLALVIVNCSGAADSEVQGNSKTGKNVKESGVLPDKDDSAKENVLIPVKNGKDQVGSGVKERPDSKVSKDGTNKELGVKGGAGEQKKTDDTGSELKKSDDTGSKLKQTNDSGSEQKKLDDTGSEQKKKNDKGTGKDSGNKEKAGGGSDLQSKDGALAQVRKEGGEACDSSSNSCTIEEKSVIACLRVQGSDSEELSLLIQNKGKGSVSVTISAPDFVQLGKKQIQVQDGKNEKVTVSIGNGESKSGIVLKAGNSNCTIDFKEMSAQSTKKDTVSVQLAYINLLKSTPSIWFVSFAAVLVLASTCIGISFRRKYVARNSPSYEKLEMELPVSGGSKVVPDSSNDGWDDSWGDSWDDEEAPKTPSMPVTPSLSSHGMASRRINKDAWKD